MDGEIDTYDECIKSDLDWLKNELLLLTKEQRCLILSEYERKLGEYSIGVKEYTAFIDAFNQVAD